MVLVFLVLLVCYRTLASLRAVKHSASAYARICVRTTRATQSTHAIQPHRSEANSSGSLKAEHHVHCSTGQYNLPESAEHVRGTAPAKLIANR